MADGAPKTDRHVACAARIRFSRSGSRAAGSCSEATACGSTPSAGANGRLRGTRASVSKIDVAATREYQATGLPESSNPALMRIKLAGR